MNLDSLTNSFFEEWKNVPYRFGGNNKNGIDCSKFAKKYYEQVYGLDIPSTCVRQFASGIEVLLSELKVGDLVYFTSKVSPSGWHCGVYIGNDQFMHAANYRDGIKISCLEDPMYKRLLKGFRRFIKTENPLL